MSGIIAALVAGLKSIPAIASLIERFFGEWQAYEVRKREAEAAARKVAKDDAVDAALERLCQPPDPARKQPEVGQ